MLWNLDELSFCNKLFLQLFSLWWLACSAGLVILKHYMEELREIRDWETTKFYSSAWVGWLLGELEDLLLHTLCMKEAVLWLNIRTFLVKKCKFQCSLCVVWGATSELNIACCYFKCTRVCNLIYKTCCFYPLFAHDQKLPLRYKGIHRRKARVSKCFEEGVNLCKSRSQ